MRAMIRIVMDPSNQQQARADACMAMTKLSLTQFELQRNYVDIDGALVAAQETWKRNPQFETILREFRGRMTSELAQLDGYNNHPVINFWRDVVNHSYKPIVFSPYELSIVVKVLAQYTIGSFEELLMIKETDLRQHRLIKDSERCGLIPKEFYNIATATKLAKDIYLGDYQQPMGYVPLPVKWPTLFEIADAWSPAAKDRFGCRRAYVAELSKCFAIEDKVGRFSIDQVIGDLSNKNEERCRFEGHKGIPLTVQKAQLRNFQQSLAAYASHLRSFGRFCLAKGVQQLPPRKDVVELFCASFKSSAHVTGFIAAVTNACDFIGCSKDGLNTEVPKHIADGLKKYRREKPTTFFSADQIQHMVGAALNTARVVAPQIRGGADFGRLAMEFGAAVLIAFVFQVRFASEAQRLEVSHEDDEESELKGRLRVLVKPMTGPQRVILKLARRKNRQSFKAEGHQIIRYCSCDPETAVFQTEFSRERNPFSKKITHEVKVYPAFRGERFCPYHKIWPMCKGLTQDPKMDRFNPAEKVFNILDPRVFTSMLKTVVANETPK